MSVHHHCKAITFRGTPTSSCVTAIFVFNGPDSMYVLNRRVDPSYTEGLNYSRPARSLLLWSLMISPGCFFASRVTNDTLYASTDHIYAESCRHLLGCFCAYFCPTGLVLLRFSRSTPELKQPQDLIASVGMGSSFLDVAIMSATREKSPSTGADSTPGSSSSAAGKKKKGKGANIS